MTPKDDSLKRHAPTLIQRGCGLPGWLSVPIPDDVYPPFKEWEVRLMEKIFEALDTEPQQEYDLPMTATDNTAIDAHDTIEAARVTAQVEQKWGSLSRLFAAYRLVESGRDLPVDLRVSR